MLSTVITQKQVEVGPDKPRSSVASSMHQHPLSIPLSYLEHTDAGRTASQQHHRPTNLAELNISAYNNLTQEEEGTLTSSPDWPRQQPYHIDNPKPYTPYQSMILAANPRLRFPPQIHWFSERASNVGVSVFPMRSALLHTAAGQPTSNAANGKFPPAHLYHKLHGFVI
ncbi:hypothetical protein M378DRAFT_7348 [Amanita muscaria Koide BX008]|uniref:Uncharacterized protein n=1 Tax=Amanita muscaria (strain Koide BX008) TaxID=946122 RepID=A0A0C2X872_AMAMK|nr:hypothetical protein M378DRAFT_7348 [Amanita muscaria Koide BX008]